MLSLFPFCFPVVTRSFLCHKAVPCHPLSSPKYPLCSPLCHRLFSQRFPLFSTIVSPLSRVSLFPLSCFSSLDTVPSFRGLVFPFRVRILFVFSNFVYFFYSFLTMPSLLLNFLFLFPHVSEVLMFSPDFLIFPSGSSGFLVVVFPTRSPMFSSFPLFHAPCPVACHVLCPLSPSPRLSFHVGG